MPMLAYGNPQFREGFGQLGVAPQVAVALELPTGGHGLLGAAAEHIHDALGIVERLRCDLGPFVRRQGCVIEAKQSQLREADVSPGSVPFVRALRVDLSCEARRCQRCRVGRPTQDDIE